MPNWCHNTLEVRGPASLLAAYAEYVKTDEQPLTFEADVPRPEFEGAAWYDWSIENWGTKWDASFSGPMIALGTDAMDVDRAVEAQGVYGAVEVLVYKFDTAWSPPTPWLEATGLKWPELEFVLTYAELGADYAGRMGVKGWVAVHDQDLAVEDVLSPEEMWY
jgi:hypothetical protein